jgi:hypothetical protein
MRAFVEPAIADGWRLVEARCGRTGTPSEMQFIKRVTRPSRDVTVGLVLLLSSEDWGQRGGATDQYVELDVSVPREHWPDFGLVEPMDQLLHTGVPRTDPACLRAGRDPSATQPEHDGALGPWTAIETCAVVVAAWPVAQVEPGESGSCVVTALGQFRVQPLASVDSYLIEDGRRAAAGGPSLFATTDGGFWVLRPDGIALRGSPIGRSSTDQQGGFTGAQILRLAARLASAPGPA